jgi:beta-hydroxylase
MGLADAGRTVQTGRSQFVARTLRKGMAASIKQVEAVNRRHSLVGNPPIFDPAMFPWTKAVEEDWRAVRAELDEVLKYPAGIPNFQDISVEQKSITNDDRWKTFFFYGYGLRNDANCEICPATARLLSRIPGMTTAFFSILLPGKRIPSHRGPYNGVLRYHLGLIVPDPARCGIIVGGQRAHWEEGKSLIFDDTFQHEAWNDGDEIRVVLFVDFMRPLATPAAQLNRAFLRFARMTDFIQAGMRRQQKWNAAFAELYNQYRS